MTDGSDGIGFFFLPPFEGGGLKIGTIRQGQSDHFKAPAKGEKLARVFVGRKGRGDEDNPVQSEGLPDLQAGAEMPQMNGIEGPAEEADSFPIRGLGFKGRGKRPSENAVRRRRGGDDTRLPWNLNRWFLNSFSPFPHAVVLFFLSRAKSSPVLGRRR